MLTENGFVNKALLDDFVFSVDGCSAGAAVSSFADDSSVIVAAKFRVNLREIGKRHKMIRQSLLAVWSDSAAAAASSCCCACSPFSVGTSSLTSWISVADI